jgi:hypothetical protein
MRNIINFLLIFLLFFLYGCAKFNHLTDVSSGTGKGPRSADCGACHLDQYKEWQGSAHSLAYLSPSFRDATENYQDESCLPCHIPENIQAEPLTARMYNREDGISCPSCHLHNGKMTGPEMSSALFSPHPIQEYPSFFRSSNMCGICHQNTFESWQQEAATNKNVPSCQECHQAMVTRKATKGTNLFSNILVAFEEDHHTRSHRITLSFMEHFPDTAHLSIVSETKGQGSIDLVLDLANLLPHDLPAGAFGDKTLWLVISLLDKENQAIIVSENELCCREQPLSPRETRRMSFRFNGVPRGLASLSKNQYKAELIREQPQSAKSLTLFSGYLP